MLTENELDSPTVVMFDKGLLEMKVELFEAVMIDVPLALFTPFVDIFVSGILDNFVLFPLGRLKDLLVLNDGILGPPEVLLGIVKINVDSRVVESP